VLSGGLGRVDSGVLDRESHSRMSSAFQFVFPEERVSGSPKELSPTFDLRLGDDIPEGVESSRASSILEEPHPEEDEEDPTGKLLFELLPTKG
jgi:hypothetical protein